MLKHYDVPCEVPSRNFKVKCKYCPKEIMGSCKATRNWWKHLVSRDVTQCSVTQCSVKLSIITFGTSFGLKYFEMYSR